MKLPDRIVHWLFNTLLSAVVAKRPPDFVVGADNPDGAYLLRWYVFGSKPHPRDPDRRVARSFLGLFRPYLHCFLRSDDDRAHHDHPAASISLSLHGAGTEHTIDRGGIHVRHTIGPGEIRLRSARFAHRIEIAPGEKYWTLFVFFRNTREWGFHCPESGWKHWRAFTAAGKPGEIGPGCDA